MTEGDVGARRVVVGVARVLWQVSLPPCARLVPALLCHMSLQSRATCLSSRVPHLGARVLPRVFVVCCRVSLACVAACLWRVLSRVFDVRCRVSVTCAATCP